MAGIVFFVFLLFLAMSVPIAIAMIVSTLVPLIAGAGFCYPAAETERLTTRICLDEPLRAPVSAGKTVGAAVFCLNGTEIGRVPLVAGRTVMPKVSSALAGLKLELKDE